MLMVLMMVPVSHQNAEVFLKLNSRVTRRVTKWDPVHFRHTEPLTTKPDARHADIVLLK